MGSPPLLVSMPTPMIAVTAATHVVQDTWQHRGHFFTTVRKFPHGQQTSCADCEKTRAVGQIGVHMPSPCRPLLLQQLPGLANTSLPLLRSCCV